MTTTLCSTQDVLDRAGVYLNSTIAGSTTILERYINTSEGMVVSETRINWINEYSSVNASVKEELRICVASHAANAMIKYDMRNFPTSAQAVTLLNVNYEDFNRSLKALKDFDTNKIRSVNI